MKKIVFGFLIFSLFSFTSLQASPQTEFAPYKKPQEEPSDGYFWGFGVGSVVLMALMFGFLANSTSKSPKTFSQPPE